MELQVAKYMFNTNQNMVRVKWGQDDIPDFAGIEKHYNQNWNEINWKQLERRVFKLQKRIYKASQRGDVKSVRRLQKTLMNSWSAKCLAVRRVTQDNQGKKTAGIDGKKLLTPVQRLTLVTNLKPEGKAKPTRRIWIPKPGTEEKRPLGIPTIADRASQALVKQTLEPEWEAKFEPNSYGFRPGRASHDAIEAIHKAINKQDKYVLDADISKCFDRINHEALLSKLDTYPRIRRQIKAWLKSGVLDGKELYPTEEGTPQGGVITPPTILQTFWLRLWDIRDLSYPKNHIYLLSVHLNSFYQQANNFSLSIPI